MKPYLPQQEPNPTARENMLKKNREDYQFDHKFLAPIPTLIYETQGGVSQGTANTVLPNLHLMGVVRKDGKLISA